MAKKEVVKKLAMFGKDRIGDNFTNDNAKEIFELIFGREGMITTTLKEEGKIQLTGFGTFLLKEKAARDARNPRTGEEVRVPARKAVVFVPGVILNELKEEL